MIKPTPEDEALADALLRADLERIPWWDVFAFLRALC
jgi:hypothetical protein